MAPQRNPDYPMLLSVNADIVAMVRKSEGENPPYLVEGPTVGVHMATATHEVRVDENVDNTVQSFPCHLDTGLNILFIFFIKGVYTWRSNPQRRMKGYNKVNNKYTLF